MARTGEGTTGNTPQAESRVRAGPGPVASAPGGGAGLTPGGGAPRLSLGQLLDHLGAAVARVIVAPSQGST